MSIEPMTAAEWRGKHYGDEFTRRVHAALEERERLLDELADLYEATARRSNEAEALKSDAALGALVRRIREHPKNRDRPYPIRPFGCDSVFSIDAAGLTAFLRHLDSLLPKEPEVVTGPSGKQYRKRGEVLEHFVSYPRSNDPTRYSPPDAWERLEIVTLSDAPVVAKLMAGGGK